ncbi:tetratricopeptide repeat domain protein [Geoanaerobacter pelophilus]|uniref:Tetratricopeptide repeat domain protein n=1 Tax=Geoanaerobacter pelophilus TaxID=60036 RepID=A0ABQ0MFB9_9BACT|nr:hypothetical protein [Geoanaerobacter pelophilus]GAW65790.1 tetratricopeptide repeat domain protein [Geoanaerobacter pelophilus]
MPDSASATRHKRLWIGRLTALLPALVLLFSAATSLAVDSLPTDHPKYQKVKAIYDSVARAFGDGRVPPRLIVSPVGAASRNAVAWSDPGTEGAIGLDADSGPLQAGYIAIEEKICDLFASLGDDQESAIAFLLGHELTHYYMRHGWVGDFGNSFASLEVGRKMIKAASYEDVIKRETEADYFGGFYGHLAGYDTLGVAPRAIELIYASYKLPSKLPNYPTRAEREAIAERAEANLRKLVPVFEAGNRLLLLEKYEATGRLFEHLAHTFPSREMFNNAGVAYASESLRLFRPGTLKFGYPFEFDAETRLKAKGQRAKGLPDEFAERRNRLLQKGADNFDKAIQRDRGYAAAYVNLAAVDTLIGDRDNAIILANKAMEMARRNNETITLANALVVRGIAYAEGGNKEKSMVDMAAARNLGSGTAAFNLAQLQDEKGAAPKIPGGSEASGAETIARISPRDDFVKSKEVATFSLKGVDKEEPTITVYSRQGSGWEDMLISVDGQLVRLVSAGKGYQEKSSRGIGVGSSSEELAAKYGEPSRMVTSRQGTYYLYQKGEMIFAADPQGRVTGWMIYTVQ